MFAKLLVNSPRAGFIVILKKVSMVFSEIKINDAIHVPYQSNTIDPTNSKNSRNVRNYIVCHIYMCEGYWRPLHSLTNMYALIATNETSMKSIVFNAHWLTQLHLSLNWLGQETKHEPPFEETHRLTIRPMCPRLRGSACKRDWPRKSFGKLEGLHSSSYTYN